MVEPRYAYAYACIRESDGRCIQVKDTSNYVENRLYIPLETYDSRYVAKYYYPIPTAYGDFNGLWYYDAAHTNQFIP